MNYLELAKQAGLKGWQAQAPGIDGALGSWEAIEALCKLAAAHEREACAKVCDYYYKSWINIEGRYEFMGEGAQECAEAIRARGET